MDLVKGYKFFSPQECEKMRGYCDKKERKLEKMLKKDADKEPEEGKVRIPLTQKHHYLYNFFAENPEYQPRLIKCVKELAPHLEFPIAVQSWVNVYRTGDGELGSLHLFPHNLNHMVPASEQNEKRYTLGITIHGYQALDKALIQGVAANNEYQETIFLNEPE